MSEIKDGGPAFSSISGNAKGFDAKPGHLTVRDAFAIAALQGILATFSDYNARQIMVDDGIANGRGPKDHVHVAVTAYEYADCMLKAREQKPAPEASQ